MNLIDKHFYWLETCNREIYALYCHLIGIAIGAMIMLALWVAFG